MATKTRIKKANAPAPENRAQVASFITEIGKRQRELDAIELRLKDRIARLEAEVADDIERIRKERNDLMNGLYSFAQSNRARWIKEAGGKSISFPTGLIQWRYTPPAVAVEDDAEMISLLREEGLDEYVRVKEELDRESLLRDREKLSRDARIEGLGFTQREEFVVIPTEHNREVKKTRTISAV